MIWPSESTVNPGRRDGAEVDAGDAGEVGAGDVHLVAALERTGPGLKRGDRRRRLDVRFEGKLDPRFHPEVGGAAAFRDGGIQTGALAPSNGNAAPSFTSLTMSIPIVSPAWIGRLVAKACVAKAVAVAGLLVPLPCRRSRRLASVRGAETGLLGAPRTRHRTIVPLTGEVTDAPDSGRVALKRVAVTGISYRRERGRQWAADGDRRGVRGVRNRQDRQRSYKRKPPRCMSPPR